MYYQHFNIIFMSAAENRISADLSAERFIYALPYLRGELCAEIMPFLLLFHQGENLRHVVSWRGLYLTDATGQLMELATPHVVFQSYKGAGYEVVQPLYLGFDFRPLTKIYLT